MAFNTRFVIITKVMNQSLLLIDFFLFFDNSFIKFVYIKIKNAENFLMVNPIDIKRFLTKAQYHLKNLKPTIIILQYKEPCCFTTHNWLKKLLDKLWL